MAQKKSLKYVKMDQREHPLLRPDMYVGSTQEKVVQDYVAFREGERMYIAKQSISISPAILRIFVEPLSNILDNTSRGRERGINTTEIRISIDQETGTTTLFNDGAIIPVEMHPVEKCYNHTMIFGHLLTSSNYDDSEDRKDISGRNGLGVKLTNIFSSTFTVSGLDPKSGKTFTQTWTENMKHAGAPVVKSTKLKRGYTEVSYVPDFPRFGLTGYTSDILSLYTKYVIDCAMITRVPVYLNDELIPVKSLLDYSTLFRNPSPQSGEGEEEEDGKDERLCIRTSECEVVLTTSYTGFEAISFANGVYTSGGGVHVEAWAEALFRPIVQKLNKPKKPQLNISDVKRFFKIFVSASVDRPTFESQSKHVLESPEVKAEVSKTQISTILKWPVIKRIEDVIRSKELVVLKKSERKKRGYEHVEGLEPANNEGGKKGRDCILIIVEGLSAKEYAAIGLEKGVFGKTGRDWCGIYPIRGKLLNCRDAKPVTITKNKVVTAIIKILGLQHGVDYTLEENYSKLRYGKILIITDADVDGIHISGLIQNMFHSLFSSLLEREEPFITAMQTPIVRVYPSVASKASNILFYSENEYRKYVKEFEQKNPGKKIRNKYYKGLGSSNKQDILETFGEKMVEFISDKDTYDSMNKVFNKKMADARKAWLESYDPDKTAFGWEGPDQEIRRVSFSAFIDQEMIRFSIDDCKRSIPCLVDGLKEGHRKVLYVVFLRNLSYKKPVIKVGQLSGAVSELSGYHHGEENLQKTITAMAQSFIGSNNIPLLFGDGLFGSRSEGGKDAANARYIWTKLEYLTRLIFRKEDDELLSYQEDDGQKIEPKYYVPILPTILVNGCVAGIGTGWSCSVPCYDPMDLVTAIRVWLDNGFKIRNFSEDGKSCSILTDEIRPWYRGHTGEMLCDAKGKRYTSWGCIQDGKRGVAEVIELPVGMWTCNFRETLEGYKEEKKIKGFKDYSIGEKVLFQITPCEDGVECTLEGLKLYKHITLSNMVLFDQDGKLKRYDSVEEIIESFCEVRYDMYVKRKVHNLNKLETEIKYLGNKRRFLEEVRDGDLKLFVTLKGKRESRSTSELVKELVERGYDKEGCEAESLTPSDVRGGEGDEKEDDDVEEGDEESNITQKGSGYGYLLKLQISSITKEKILKLKKDIDTNIRLRDELMATSEKDIWLRELAEFETEYRKWQGIIAKREAVPPKKKKGARSAPVGAR